MANPITSTRIVAGVKRRITLPASQALLDDADILDLANDVIKEQLIPMIISVRQNYFVVTSDTALVTGQTKYDIPPRAAGRTLRDLKVLVSGSESQIRDMSLISIEDVGYYSATTSNPRSFYFFGDKVALVGDLGSTNDVLRFYIERYPSDLTETQYSSVVQSVTSNVVTVDQVSSSIVAGSLVDFINKTVAHEIKQESTAVAGTTSTTITFATAADIPTDIAVGDYISLEETTPVLQLPKECWPFLELQTSIRVLNAIGDFEGAQMLDKQNKMSEQNMLKLLEPRIRGEATKIMNRRGLLRGSRLMGRYNGSVYN